MSLNRVQLILFVLLLWSAQAFSTPINILVPTYANPCCNDGATMWDSLISAAGNPGVNISLILNPASGPGNTTDPNFINTQGNGPLADFRNAGGSVYGYVPTNFANRLQNDVLTDVDKYYDTLYTGLVDGIFFDEMSNDLAKVGFYQAINDYVHSKDNSALVISNPGTSFTNNPSGQTIFSVSDYANSADVLMAFENSGEEYLNNYSPPSWVNSYSADHFAHVIHTQGVWDDNLIDLAVARNAGFVYFTDDQLPNPYDKLSSYWDQQVTDISAQNTSAVPVPGAIYLLISGLSFLSLCRKKQPASLNILRRIT